MSTDDKFGIGAGLLALGLAAGVILLGQLTYNKDAQAELDKIPAAASDSAKAPQSDTAPAAQPSLLYRLIPHRELVVPEAIFDGILCAPGLARGHLLLRLGNLGAIQRK